MAERTANLIVRLQDMVSGPARAAAAGLNKIKTAVKGIDGMTGRAALDGMIARNNKNIQTMRFRMLDAAAAAYALKRAIGAPINAAIEFESSMADVKKVVDAFSDESTFGKFQTAIKELSREIPRSVAELSQIAAAAGQAGLPHDEIVEFTRQVAMISTAFELSTEDTGRTLARLKAALNLSVADVVLLADHMNVLANNMATSEGEVMSIVGRVGALGDVAGISAKQIAALGAAMNSANVDAETAATAIRNMILNTTGIVTKDAGAALKNLGFDPSKFKTEVADKGVFAYRELFQRIGALKKEDQAGVLQSIFGKRAVDALGPLMNNLKNLDDALKLVESDTKNAGAAKREFDVRAATLGNSLQTLNNRISELSINVGSALIPALNSMVSTVGPIITSIAEWASLHPQLTTGIVATTTGLVGLRIAAIAFGYGGAVIKSGLLGVTNVVTKLIPFLGTLRTAFMFTGVGAVIAGIAAVGLTIYNNWQGLTAFFEAFGSALSSTFAPIMPLLTPIIDGFVSVKDAISGLLQPINATNEEWASWGETAGSAIANLISDLNAFPGQVIDAFAGIIKTLTDYATQFYDAGVEIGTSLWDGLKSIFDQLVGWVSAKAAAIYAPIAGIAGKVRGAFNAVGNFFGGNKGTPGPTGARVGGGPVSRGGAYLVGEKRAEIFTPSRSGTIVPSFGGAGPIEIHQSFVINGIDRGNADELIEKARSVMRDEVREAFRGVFADTGMRFA